MLRPSGVHAARPSGTVSSPGLLNLRQADGSHAVGLPQVFAFQPVALLRSSASRDRLPRCKYIPSLNPSSSPAAPSGSDNTGGRRTRVVRSPTLLSGDLAPKR